MVADLVLSDPPQPTSKGVVGPVASKIDQFSGYGPKDFLHDVAGVSRLKPRPPTPPINVTTIRLDEAIPSGLVVQSRLPKQR
jgi:hypothetical protein